MSLCQLIEHSPHFREVFSQAVDKSSAPFQSKVTNLSSAKHRYASAQKPLGRSVLYHDALVPTALYIYHKRPATEQATAAAAYCQRLTP